MHSYFDKLISTVKSNLMYVIGSLIILIIILFEAQGKGDFFIFLSASKDVMLGKNIYQIPYNDCYHYFYDVVFALILLPFSYLPLYVVKVGWLILSVFFVYRIWKIITNWIPLTTLTKKQHIVFTVLSFIFIARFIRDNLHLAQVTIAISYLALEGLYLIEKDKKIAGSSLIALGINIKILPIVIIPYLLYRAEWKALFYVILCSLGLLYLPALFIGVEYNNFLLAERWKLINPTNEAHILDTSERSFHSLTTLLTTLLVKNCNNIHDLNLPRNIADISVKQLNGIITIVRMLFAAATLYFLKTRPFVNKTTKIQKLYEVSYLCAVIPLIFPHQQHYAFFFIFPATTYLVFYLLTVYYSNTTAITSNFKIKKGVFIATLSTIYFLTNSHFILGQFNNYYDHYKTLTYGVIALVVLLAICNPSKLVKPSVNPL